MSTFRPLTCWWNKAAGSIGALAFAVAWVAFACAFQNTGEKSQFLKEYEAGDAQKPRDLPLFLDDFLANTEPPLISKEVRFPSALGRVAGYWARPEVQQPLPAALLVYDEDSWTDWMKTNTRHLASIGYEVLTVNVQRRRAAALGLPSSNGKGVGGEAECEGPIFTDEAALAETLAAVRWLRSRSTVLPNRLGVVGWNWSGGQALALASATSLQACIVCDAPLPSEQALVVGLRETPVLAIYGGEGPLNRKELPAFRKLAAANRVACKVHLVHGVHAGFMGPSGSKAYAHDTAEDAWVVIYNFLEKHVEDARLPVPASDRSVLTIADIMRSISAPTGVRGAMGKALEQEPGSRKEWNRIRADAALTAEAGVWLRKQPPPKGSAGHWQEQAQAFTAAAETIVDAADKRDYPAARRGLTQLAGQCAACHLEHRN